jgi:Mg-chelatase subunit ChlD
LILLAPVVLVSSRVEADRAGDDSASRRFREELPLHPFPRLDAEGLPVGISLTSPRDGERIESAVPMVEVSGTVGISGQSEHLVVLAVDASGSAFRASGADIDRDGHLGTELCAHPSCGYPTRWTTDYDDNVLSAEVRAARALVELLEGSRTRMGIITFGRTPRRYKRIQELDGIVRALKRFPRKPRSGTDLVTAIDRCIEMLAGADRGGRATRSVILLSDGKMLFRSPEDPGQARQVAAEYLRLGIQRARDANVRVFSFAVGPRAYEPYMRHIAESTGGSYTRVSDPAAVITMLPMINLSDLSDVEVTNTTTGEPGRAIRVFPNGSFDGFVPLVAGTNLLSIEATMLSGRRIETRLELTYEKPPPSAADRGEQKRLLELLKLRRLETDLARRAQVERRRARLGRDLKIEAE